MVCFVLERKATGYIPTAKNVAIKFKVVAWAPSAVNERGTSIQQFTLFLDRCLNMWNEWHCEDAPWWRWSGTDS